MATSNLISFNCGATAGEEISLSMLTNTPCISEYVKRENFGTYI
jgi:hypothetical protein